jgi:alkylation response protein AidB-like acyl-CoA dehydrogenase
LRCGDSNHHGSDRLNNLRKIDANRIDHSSRVRRAGEQQADTSKIGSAVGRSRREAEAAMNIQNRLVTTDLARRAELVASIAAAAADAVDRETKFPAEAIAAARAQRLLGILVPTELGGEEASVSDVVDVCYARGRSCASTGMIYAMHQMMVAALVRHAGADAWHRRLLRRIADEQLLLASSTTEGQGGGDLRKSACAVERRNERIALEKSATVIFYGAQADVLDGAARARLAADRSGAGCPRGGRLSARAAGRLGHARHARHLQRGLHAQGRGRAGPGALRCLSQGAQ